MLLRWLMLAVALLVATQPGQQREPWTPRSVARLAAVHASTSHVARSTQRSDAHRDRVVGAHDVLSPDPAPSLRPPSRYLRVATREVTDRVGFAAAIVARSRAPPAC